MYDYEYERSKRKQKPERKKPEKKEPDYSWMWWIVIFAAFWLYGQFNNSSSSSSDAPRFPGDSTGEGAEYQADQMEQDTRDYDLFDRYTPEPPDDPYDTPPEYSGSSGSPVSCDIKGNISMDGEKIYHVPGQEYYDATVIDESYGERWFCTEDEARAAGWRKAKN